MGRLLASPQIIENAEAAGIVEADHGAIIEGQDDMVVLRVGAIRVAGDDPARHAEMQQQQPGLVELDQDVFAAACQSADQRAVEPLGQHWWERDRKSTRLNSSHLVISYAVFCLKK